MISLYRFRDKPKHNHQKWNDGDCYQLDEVIGKFACAFQYIYKNRLVILGDIRAW
jgi:hypothetical protein